MTLWESFITAWRALLANKLRTALTMLGIIIGVSAFVFVVSLGKGHQANITAIFEAMGANAIYITSAIPITERIMAGTTGILTLEDAEALADPIRAPSIAVVAPILKKCVTWSSVIKIPLLMFGASPLKFRTSWTTQLSPAFSFLKATLSGGQMWLCWDIKPPQTFSAWQTL